jgi:hypothetical protein
VNESRRSEIDALRSEIDAGRDYANKRQDAFRQAIIDLLRNSVPINMLVSQYMREQAAAELERLWRPEVEKLRSRLRKAEERRWMLEKAEALNRQEGVERPRSAAKKEMARFFGYSSGEALRKDLQPNRVNRRPRRKPRS